MEMIEAFMTVIMIVSAIAVLAFLDKRFNLGLNAGLGGYGASYDFWGRPIDNTADKVRAEKDTEIKALKSRIEALEKIVTDPAEQLKREIDQLK
ncbi:hypothetical protein HII17_00250 [Thalassotalea sp. M1531]|uniref:Uncharacterized protein n=1 Tax=Thalassotalea algicola TaxID=2716224 RepID=A0A7Y0Q6H9_9GAMM|nr:hypothetical protein [Thalassotalea algicola]NMP29975.1 hypothetical protein [Thalassotalea algicola]